MVEFEMFGTSNGRKRKGAIRTVECNNNDNLELMPIAATYGTLKVIQMLL